MGWEENTHTHNGRNQEEEDLEKYSNKSILLPSFKSPHYFSSSKRTGGKWKKTIWAVSSGCGCWGHHSKLAGPEDKKKRLPNLGDNLYAYFAQKVSSHKAGRQGSGEPADFVYNLPTAHFCNRWTLLRLRRHEKVLIIIIFFLRRLGFCPRICYFRKPNEIIFISIKTAVLFINSIFNFYSNENHLVVVG